MCGVLLSKTFKYEFKNVKLPSIYGHTINYYPKFYQSILIRNVLVLTLEKNIVLIYII